MMESLFGSTSPMWSAMASPPSAWSPIAISPVGGVPTAGAPIPSPSQIRVSAEAFGYGVSPALPLFGAGSAPVPLPAFGAAELVAPTAAVLATVAARRGQPVGPVTDAEIEDFLNDALDLIPGTSEVEVRCEGGRVILAGNVAHKRHKRDVGELVWAIPSVSDVQNNVTITTRRRQRASAAARDADASGGPVRKHT